MFGRTVVARVGLPQNVWEPIRKLRDNYDVPLDYLAEAWSVSDAAMLRVIYAARLKSLEDGEEVPGALFLDRLVGDMTHD